MQTRLSVLFVLAIIATLFLNVLQATPATAGTNGQQIMFKVQDNRAINSLRIEGLNNTEKKVVFEKTFSPAWPYAYTVKDWWWKGTLVIGADIVGIGKIVCVVDYVPEKASGDVFLVTYYGLGKGCSSAGSAASVGVFNHNTLAKVIENYVLYSDIQGNLDTARNMTKHLSADQLGLLNKDIGLWLTDKVYSWPCLFAVTLALPQYGYNALPLTQGTAKLCSNEVKTMNVILARWGSGQVRIK